MDAQSTFKVNEQRRAMLTLRDRFNRPDAPELTVWLIRYRLDAISIADACAATDKVSVDHCPVHALTDPSVSEYGQHLCIEPWDSPEVNRFLRLAKKAGNLLGEWSRAFGVGKYDLISTRSTASWLYALFELKWNENPGIPYDAEQVRVSNQRIGQLQAQRHFDKRLSPDQIAEINQQIEEARTHGYYAKIDDIYDASVHAIDVLSRGNLYTWSTPPFAGPRDEQERQPDRDELLRRHELIIRMNHPDWPAEVVAKEVVKRADEHELRAQQTAVKIVQVENTKDREGIEANERPKKYANGWQEILAALELTNSPSNKNRVSRLNQLHSGPISSKGKGSPPMVDQSKLIKWWNGLEHRLKEIDDRERDANATVADTHKYGKTGEVVPGIGGHVKRRRSKKLPSKENKRS